MPGAFQRQGYDVPALFPQRGDIRLLHGGSDERILRAVTDELRNMGAAAVQDAVGPVHGFFAPDGIVCGFRAEQRIDERLVILQSQARIDRRGVVQRVVREIHLIRDIVLRKQIGSPGDVDVFCDQKSPGAEPDGADLAGIEAVLLRGTTARPR